MHKWTPNGSIVANGSIIAFFFSYHPHAAYVLCLKTRFKIEGTEMYRSSVTSISCSYTSLPITEYSMALRAGKMARVIEQISIQIASLPANRRDF